MQDVRVLNASIVEPIAIGALEGTFGPVTPNLKFLLARKKVSAYRVHLLNGPCHRGKNCERTEPALDDFKALSRRAQRLERVAKRFPQVPCFVSPVLESDVRSRNIVRRWLSVLARQVPSCVPVLSVCRGITLKGIYDEFHHKGAKANIVSNDGLPLATLRKAKADVILFAWLASFNGRSEKETKFVAPSRRKIRATRKDYSRAIKSLS